jgi:hypothetical protein
MCSPAQATPLLGDRQGPIRRKGGLDLLRLGVQPLADGVPSDPLRDVPDGTAVDENTDRIPGGGVPAPTTLMSPPCSTSGSKTGLQAAHRPRLSNLGESGIVH